MQEKEKVPEIIVSDVQADFERLTLELIKPKEADTEVKEQSTFVEPKQG